MFLLFASFVDANSCGTATTKGRSEFDPLDVLIIGAGWSGLAAANKLHQQQGDKHFCVLEARDVIGGRSRTQMGALVPDLPTELGSAWVWEGTNIFNIFRDAGLVSDEAPSYFNYDNLGLYYGPWGGLIENDSADGIWLRNEYENFEEYAFDHATHDISIQEIIDSYFEEYPNIDNVARQTIRGILCGAIHSEFGSYFRDADSEFLDGHLTYDVSINFVAVPNGGFSRALDYFSAPFLDHIQLNTQVLEIDYSETNINNVIKVTALDRTTNTTFVQYTRAVVCTVSLGVLKYGDLQFVPPLPRRKTKVIQDMGMGNINKCIMYWDKTTKDVSWWPRNQFELQLITEEDDDSMEWTFFLNDQIHAGNENNHIMTAWIGGAQADQWENLTDEETISHIMVNMQRMFPPPIYIPEPTNYVITRWKSDPFTRGTYHYHRVGVDTYGGEDILSEPVGEKIFFAGEATTSGMSAPDAYSSGERAIDQIIESGVLDNIPNESSTCSRVAHSCRNNGDCCEGLTCQQRAVWSFAMHCTAARPGVLSIEATENLGSEQQSAFRPRTPALQGKDKEV
jgi:monoamine oxidase